MARPRLTRHQRETYDRLLQLSHYNKQTGTWTWVPLKRIGSRGALDHLVEKGYAYRIEDRGPRGGRYFWYGPSALLPRHVTHATR